MRRFLDDFGLHRTGQVEPFAHRAGGGQQVVDSGKVFDSSYDRREPIKFPLNRVVKGWSEGMQLVGQGGMIELEGGPQLQPILDRLTRVLNLMNRVTLQLMGYEGAYTDYTLPFWPSVPFPAAPAGSL